MEQSVPALHASAATSPLLRLPAELRMMVYTFVLVCEKPLHPSNDADSPIAGAGLLATNKQIYHEARELLYEKNTFQLTTYNDQVLVALPGAPLIPNLKITWGGRKTPNKALRSKHRNGYVASLYLPRKEIRCQNLITLEINSPPDCRTKKWFFTELQTLWPQHHGWNLDAFYLQVLNKEDGVVIWQYKPHEQKFQLRHTLENDLSVDDLGWIFDSLRVLMRKIVRCRDSCGSWQVECPFVGNVNVKGKIDFDAYVGDNYSKWIPPYRFDLNVVVSTDPNVRKAPPDARRTQIALFSSNDKSSDSD